MSKDFKKFSLYDNEERTYHNSTKDVDTHDDEMMQEYIKWCREHVNDTNVMFWWSNKGLNYVCR